MSPRTMLIVAAIALAAVAVATRVPAVRAIVLPGVTSVTAVVGQNIDLSTGLPT